MSASARCQMSGCANAATNTCWLAGQPNIGWKFCHACADEEPFVEQRVPFPYCADGAEWRPSDALRLPAPPEEP